MTLNQAFAPKQNAENAERDNEEEMDEDRMNSEDEIIA